MSEPFHFAILSGEFNIDFRLFDSVDFHLDTFAAPLVLNFGGVDRVGGGTGRERGREAGERGREARREGEGSGDRGGGKWG